MKRDWDLIRAILVRTEEKPPGQMLMDSDVSGYDLAEIRHHIDMLHQAGFLDAKLVKGSMGAIASAVVLGIHFSGYDLLETIRSKSIWEQVKKSAKDKGVELTFESVKLLGKAALEAVLSGGIG